MRTLVLTILFLMSCFFSATSQAASRRGGDGPDPLNLQETLWATSDGRFALSLSKCHGNLFRCQVELWNVQGNSIFVSGRVVSAVQTDRDRMFLIEFVEASGNSFHGTLWFNEHRKISLMLSQDQTSANFEMFFERP